MAQSIEIDGKNYTDGSIPGFESGGGKWRKFSKDELEKMVLTPLETEKSKVLEESVNSDWEYPGTEGLVFTNLISQVVCKCHRITPFFNKK